MALTSDTFLLRLDLGQADASDEGKKANIMSASHHGHGDL